MPFGPYDPYNNSYNGLPLQQLAYQQSYANQLQAIQAFHSPQPVLLPIKNKNKLLLLLKKPQ